MTAIPRKLPDGPVHKAAEIMSISKGEALFRASSEKPDRLGDVVRQNWELKNFNKNPILAYGHATDASAFPIGKVKKFWVDGGESFAKVFRMPEGMDETADKVWRMVEEKFLNAVSVAYLPVDMPVAIFGEDGSFKGFEFPRNELLELSVVMVPAHQDALAVRREYKLSDRDCQRIFRPPGVPATVASAKRFVEIQRMRVCA